MRFRARRWRRWLRRRDPVRREPAGVSRLLSCPLCHGAGPCWCLTDLAMYTIRRARPSDTDAIRELDWKCFPDDTDVDLEEAKAVWWVVEHRGKVVGFAGAKPWRYAGEGALVLHRAGVARAHRGQGLQRRLIGARLAYAKREGFSVVWTYTTHRNVVSSNNLIRAGFTLWMPKHWQGSAKPWKPEGDYAFLYWQRKVAK